MIFRVMSYNIHKCIGSLDRKYNPQRIVDTISNYNPDILLLQEVDKGVPRSRHDDQTNLLADHLGYRYRLFQSNVKLKYGGYGNAVLSKYPLSQHTNIDLTVRLKKRRRSLATHIKFIHNGHTRSIKILNVHLGLAAYERAIQVKNIIKNDYVTNNPHNLPIILGGDFNDLWKSLCRKFLYNQDFKSALGKTKTYPSFYPSLTLDRIFYQGELSLINAFAGHSMIARSASDHLPIIADFSIKI